jgi:hypothetical protein
LKLRIKKSPYSAGPASAHGTNTVGSAHMLFWPNGVLRWRGAACSRAVTTRSARWRARRWPDDARPTKRSCRREPRELRGGIGQGEEVGFSPQRAGGGEAEERSAAAVVPVDSGAPVIGGDLRVGLLHGEAKGKVRGQPDWRREVHGGELTEAAASKPTTPMCL